MCSLNKVKHKRGAKSPTEEITQSINYSKRSTGLSPGQTQRSQHSKENKRVQHKRQKNKDSPGNCKTQTNITGGTHSCEEHGRQNILATEG